MDDFSARLKKVYNNIKFRETFSLVWNISPARTIWSIIFVLLENICLVGLLYSVKQLINKLGRPTIKLHIDIAMNAVLLTSVLSVLYVSIKAISAYLSDVQAAKVNHSIDAQIHLHTIKLDFSYYENPEYLDILKRAKEAGIGRPYAVVVSLLDIGKNSAMLATVGYVLISIDWKLLPMLAFSVLPILAVRLKFAEKMYRWQRKNTGLEREVSYLSSLMTGDVTAKEIRAFNLGNWLLKKYSAIRDVLLEQQLSMDKRRVIIELITTVIVTAAYFLVMAYIVFGALKGTRTVGDIALFIIIFPQTFTIMQNLMTAISKLYQNNIYLADVFELFNLQPTIEAPRNVVKEHDFNENKDIVIDNVSFKYPHGVLPVLTDINMVLPSGKITALVGLNGAGKSTLIKLLCRLYDPVEGTIRFDAQDIRELNVADYRSQVSVVFQDFVRYNMTVAENIWLGNIQKEKDPGAIEKAAIDSGAAGFVGQFPLSYDTMLGRVFDEGHEISIGQWQKLAIARAFYSNSKLVILDEATSALDTISEIELFRKIKQTLGNRSTLVISHRLSTIQQADFIYVMADKRIVEYGTHDTLMSLNGRYAALYDPDKTQVH